MESSNDVGYYALNSTLFYPPYRHLSTQNKNALLAIPFVPFKPATTRLVQYKALNGQRKKQTLSRTRMESSNDVGYHTLNSTLFYPPYRHLSAQNNHAHLAIQFVPYKPTTTRVVQYKALNGQRKKQTLSRTRMESSYDVAYYAINCTLFYPPYRHSSTQNKDAHLVIPFVPY